jgi:hypothetical protein
MTEPESIIRDGSILGRLISNKDFRVLFGPLEARKSAEGSKVENRQLG